MTPETRAIRAGEAHLAAADGVRGLACLLVLVVHALQWCVPSLNFALSGTGKYGVWLFFVLSAFLLTRRFERTGFAPGALRDYLRSRALRILPPFVLAVLVYRALGTPIASSQDMIDALALQRGFAHLWTVPVEVVFYAWLPLFAVVGLTLRRRGGVAALLAGALVFALVHQSLWPAAETPRSSIDLRWYLSCFAAGVLAASLPMQRTPAPWRVDCASVALLATLVLAAPEIQSRWLDIAAPVRGLHTWLGLAWAGWLLLVIHARAGATAALVLSRPLVALGRWSYSIYLLHWAACVLVARHVGSGGFALLLTLAASIALGAASYRLLERPLARLATRRRTTSVGDARTAPARS